MFYKKDIILEHKLWIRPARSGNSPQWPIVSIVYVFGTNLYLGETEVTSWIKEEGDSSGTK